MKNGRIVFRVFAFSLSIMLLLVGCSHLEKQEENQDMSTQSGFWEIVSSAEQKMEGLQPDTHSNMTDGSGYINTSAWKHDRLDDNWVAPEGTCGMEIHGFDFRFWVYQAGELRSSFYFNGMTAEEDLENNRFDLLLSGEQTVCGVDGSETCTVEKIRYEGEEDAIYVQLRKPGQESETIRLVRAASIAE